MNDDIYLDGAERYYAKRKAGLSPVNKSGWESTAEIDRQSAAAESYAASIMGCEFNSEVYATHGDGGFDFKYELEVEVYLAMHPRAQYLIIDNKHYRWADIYVVVTGSIEEGFEVRGWTSHRRLAQEPLKDFGYGDRLNIKIDDLWSMDRLLGLKREA